MESSVMKTTRLFNFSAGPGTLPLSVLQVAQQHLVSLPGVGMSIMELSHRSSAFEEILGTAEANLRDLMKLPEHYRILFLHGGATLQFSMIPISFLRGTGSVAEYVVSGTWGQKALNEARREGDARVSWTGEKEGFTRAPLSSEINIGADAAYAHLTSNETIQGIQLQDQPLPGTTPMFCDMSSDFLSRAIDIERYALFYAGAQKNAGPAGVTVVVIREDLLERASTDIHTLLDYRVHVAHDSMYNTPPVFAIYVVMLVTQWLRDKIGGLENMGTINEQKSKMLYDVIDQSNGFYRGHARPDSRSRMNVTWHISDDTLATIFARQAQERELVNLNGHRSMGGFRASIYNAMPIQGVRALRDLMLDFQTQYSG